MGNKAFSDALTFTRASSGSYYAANGALRIAATNEPRYDYDPVTLAMRGILIEEARSNLLLYSNYFDNAVSWNKTTSTIASNAAISPDGTMSASFMTATAGGGRVTQIAAATATSLIFSVYVKQGNALTQQFIIRNNTTATNLVAPILNWATKTTNAPATTSVTSVGNGWYRVAIACTTGVTIGDSMQYYTYAGASGNAVGDTVYMYGAQVEAGTFATSYIPTSASAVARSADSVSVNNFSSWFNSSEGTFVAQVDTGSIDNAAVFAVGSTTSDIIRFFRQSDGQPVFQDIVGSTNLANLGAGVGSWLQTSSPKAAMVYGLNDFRLSVNGGSVISDISGTVPIVTQMTLGTSPGLSSLNGHIKKLYYYPAKLSTAQLQALTV